jgi:hypothetical protein
VLLARITVSAQPGYAIVWKYNFLKDWFIWIDLS